MDVVLLEPQCGEVCLEPETSRGSLVMGYNEVRQTLQLLSVMGRVSVSMLCCPLVEKL